ncbi:MAG: transporter substrate-binding domain-containing protein, partial [Gammaproteobacteria bacterium]|nr:transporter substrate-binding domain-containing protein [Gammaproteobacteria bacterium]
MLTLNGPGTYYLWRGELIGFEYELLQAFAESVGVALEVVVAAHREELMPWLAVGRGDVVSAGVTATEERREAGSLFSTPYLRVQEVFVSRAPLGSLAELAGRRVTVQRGTSFVTTLEGLAGEVDLEIERSPAESETLIRAVAEARAEVTLADSHVAEIEAAF